MALVGLLFHLILSTILRVGTNFCGGNKVGARLSVVFVVIPVIMYVCPLYLNLAVKPAWNTARSLIILSIISSGGRMVVRKWNVPGA